MASGSFNISTNSGMGGTATFEKAAGDSSATWTGHNGKEVSRIVDRFGSEANATITLPNGKQITRNTVKTENGSQTTFTGPNGQQLSLTTQNNGNGSFSFQFADGSGNVIGGGTVSYTPQGTAQAIE